MSRRLAAYLAAGALLVSVGVASIGAYQSLAMDIPRDPDTRPPGVTSTELNRLPPDVLAMDLPGEPNTIPPGVTAIHVGDPLPPDPVPIGQAKKADFIPAVTEEPTEEPSA
jgi:hypothetical protein